MLWLYILAVVTALFFLFCLMRVGVRVTIGDIVSADVTIGFFRIQVAPSKHPEKAKPKKEKPKKEPKDLQKSLKKIPIPTKADLQLAYQMLWPPAKRALARLGRGIHIHPLTLSVTIPGRDDPAKAGETCGKACAVMWTVMPALEELLDIKKPSLHVGVDYDGAALLVRGQIGVSMRIGTMLAAGFGMALPTLRWLLKFQKAHKQPVKPAEPAENPPAAA